jgi:hypothetical protein
MEEQILQMTIQGWLRQDDGYVPMSATTHPTNSSVESMARNERHQHYMHEYMRESS